MTKPRRLTALLPFVALPLVAAEGDCNFLQAKLDSPVQAVTTILQHEDGSVEADVAIVSTEGGDAHFVTKATKVELRIPGGDVVELTKAEPGHWRLRSADDDRLKYVAGETYRTSFELDDEHDAGDAAGEDFLAVVDAPKDEITVDFEPPEFAGDTSRVTWSPSSLAALVTVRNEAGEITFTTFDWSYPEFDGGKWGSLIWGGDHQLRVDVFADPGKYTVSVCAVASQEGLDEELSAGLGIASGFMVGSCAADISIDVPE
jgi:hypothetical protein